MGRYYKIIDGVLVHKHIYITSSQKLLLELDFLEPIFEPGQAVQVIIGTLVVNVPQAVSNQKINSRLQIISFNL